MIVYYSEYSMFVVGGYVPKWLPKWASQLKTIMSDLRLQNGNFPFQNRKGCELGLYSISSESSEEPMQLVAYGCSGSEGLLSVLAAHVPLSH